VWFAPTKMKAILMYLSDRDRRRLGYEKYNRIGEDDEEDY